MSLELESLLLTGEDALSNHFMVTIPAFLGANESILSLNLRVLTISNVGRELSTYEITKRGRKSTRPGGIDDTAKEFTFTFRPDKKLRTYNSLIAWTNVIKHEQLGTMVVDPLYRVIITVTPVDTANIPLGGPTYYEGCWPSSIDGIEYDEENGDPLNVSVTMQYTNRIAPV